MHAYLDPGIRQPVDAFQLIVPQLASCQKLRLCGHLSNAALAADEGAASRIHSLGGLLQVQTHRQQQRTYTQQQ